jgi:hypothetical protein
MARKYVQVKEILLGPKYSKNGKDVNTWLFGQVFQARLRADKHKTDKSYTCPYCDGTGMIFTVVQGSPYNTVTELVDDLSKFTEFKTNELVSEVLRELNLPVPDGVKKNGELYAAATPMYETWLADLKKARDIVNKHAKKMHRENTDKKMMQISNDPKRVSELRQVGNKLKNAFDSGMIIKTCGICGGNGYYDVGHVDIFGKQVEMMNMVYVKYVAGGKNKWDTRISTDKLYSWFKTLRVQPEIPNLIDIYVDPEPVYRKKINRWKLYTEQNSYAKRQLYLYYEQLYKGEGVSKAIVTYEEIEAFFGKLISTARVKTGTLKQYLMSELREITASKDKHDWKEAGSSRTPYIGKYLFIEGPTAKQAVPKRNKFPSALFVYGAKFVSNSFQGGYAAYSWSKSGTEVSDLINSSFDNAKELNERKFFVFFPQRTAHYNII